MLAVEEALEILEQFLVVALEVLVEAVQRKLLLLAQMVQPILEAGVVLVDLV
jgi:hypothetical protein